MKKSNLITGILYVLFGVVCLIVALLIETKLEGILWGFAGAGIFPGIMMICKYFYWSSPKNKEQYEERLENDRIEQHDELKTKIRDRAGRYAYGIGLAVICSYSNYTIKLVNISTATLDYMRKVRTVFCPDFLAQS